MGTPASGPSFIVAADRTTTASAGVSLTAHASANTEQTAWTQIIASTAADSYGIFICLNGTGAANTATSGLVDIGVGAASSEQVLISNLAGGYSATWGSTDAAIQFYYFPLYLAAGTRIAGRFHYALIGGDTVNAAIWCLGRRRSDSTFYGTRVTTYGADVSASKGTNVTAGNSAYGTPVQLSASTANPIRYLQVGMQGSGDSTLATQRVLFELLSGASSVLIDNLPAVVTTSGAEGAWSIANMMLSVMAFDWPAGIDLRLASMMAGSTNNVHDYIVYGVD